MLSAEFGATGCHAKIEIRMTPFGASTLFTTVECFFLFVRSFFEKRGGLNLSGTNIFNNFSGEF
jgi:hypothetical protein